MKLIFAVAAALLVCRVHSQWPFANFGQPSQPAIPTNLPPLPNVAFSGFDNFATSFVNLFGSTFANSLFNMLLGRSIQSGQQIPLQPNTIPSNIPSAQSAAPLLPTGNTGGGQNPFNIPPYLNGLLPTNSYGFSAPAPSGVAAPPSNAPLAPAANLQAPPATSTQIASALNAAIGLTAPALARPDSNGQFAPAINRPASIIPLIPATIGQSDTSSTIQDNKSGGSATQSAIFSNMTDDALNPIGENDDA